jgi:HK97 family phage portal protein
VWNVDEDEVRTKRRGHPVTQLLRFPTSSPDNPGGFYSGTLLWMATIASWVLDGNAYWLKVRSAAGRVVQLWYVPHFMMEPRWPMDGSMYISHYDYMINGRVEKVLPSEVIHFRNGLDPENPRKGRSPLSAVLREVYSDDEAARFTASLLKNLGIPGVILAPDVQAAGSAQFKLSQEAADNIKTKFKETFGGDNRGEPMIMSGPTKVVTFGFSPKDLDLSVLRDIPEERITAAVGLPAAVVGLGAGLAQTKVGATMHELRDQAWQSNLIPTQRIFSEEIQTQLMPDFETDLIVNEFGFDLSHVKVLQEDQMKLAERWARLVSAGIAKRKEARSAFELPSGPEDDVYLPQPGVRGSMEELDFIDAELGKTPPTGQPTATTSTSATQVQQLQQRVHELEQELAAAKKSANDSPAFKAQVSQIERLIADLKAQKSQAVNVTVPVTIEEGAVHAPITVTTPDMPAVHVDARTTVEKGSTTVHVDMPGDLDTEFVRDANKQLIGQRTRKAS